jgi:hypothetical protein
MDTFTLPRKYIISNPIIERSVAFRELKLWVTTKSYKTGYTGSLDLCVWGNCLYIHFDKADFPHFKYPKLEKNEFMGGMRFDYYDSSFVDIDFHSGITFYEEIFLPESGKTIVKIGCEDSGEAILIKDMPRAVESFINLHNKLARASNG